MLKHGFLTFDLIPFAQAKSVLEQIQTHLADTPFLYLANTDPMSIYTETEFYHFRVREQIHLGLRLKLSPFTRPLALFKVETFQLNLGQDQHSTILGEQPRYIAVNDEDDIYLTFNERPMIKDDKFYFLGQEQHKILSKSNPTCVLALFDDEPYAFNEKCATYLRPYTQPPLAMQLGENLMFFQNLKAYTVTASNGREHEIQLQCPSCTKQMRCNTKISTSVGIFYMAPCKNLRQTQQTTQIRVCYESTRFDTFLRQRPD
jgi:adenylate cyclase class IV